MAVIRRDGWLWNFFSRIMGLKGFEGGDIVLSYGHHTVTIPTSAQAQRIWLSVDEDNATIPVCCGNINVVGAKIIDHGFVLCADVKSDLVEIQWFIEF